MATFSKVTQALAAPIAQPLELSEEALQLLNSQMIPADYLTLLMEKTLFVDAIKFLAHVLPKREAVWWACLCARNTLTDDSPVTDIKAIELAEAWVYKPTQEVCEPNMQAAEATEYKTAAGWAAMAAFWSGENISPSKESIVPPPEGLTGKAVNGAVMLAVVADTPKQVENLYRLYLSKGIDIASGGDGRKAQ